MHCGSLPLVVAFLRPERKFASIDALRRQIERDRRDAEKILTR